LAAQQIAPIAAVATVAASGPIPDAFGGVVTPGNYVLTGVDLYGSVPPDIGFTGVGTQQTAALTISCDQYNEVFGSTSSNGSGSGNTCGRLVPTERPLAAVLQSNDPSVDGTPYNATAATLDLILIQPYSSGPYVLGEYAVVDHFTLVGSAGAPPTDGADASTPPPGGARDPRCPSTPPANGAPCDPSLGPLECEYGGDAAGRCTTLAACALIPTTNAFAFAVTQSTDCGGTNDPSCPASLDAAEALPTISSPTDGGLDPRCSPDGGSERSVTCNYAGGACACVAPDTATTCSCVRGVDIENQTNGSCPAQRPLAGDACNVDGVWCGYSPLCESVSLGPSMTCVDGHWIQFEEFAGCPATSVCPQPTRP
jgi:hypothetical protein